MPDFNLVTPEGDTRERAVCATCGWVDYANPRIVVGAVVTDGARVLLCRRAIEPRSGFWTLPAGYLELNETAAEGAAREVMEEAGASVALDGVLALYDISRIGQIQIIYRGRLTDPEIKSGIESLEVRMFAWDEIPWADLAFPSVHWALDAWRQQGETPLGPAHTNPAADPRGTKPITTSAAG